MNSSQLNTQEHERDMPENAGMPLNSISDYG
jgi:hypothetical protein